MFVFEGLPTRNGENPYKNDPSSCCKTHQPLFTFLNNNLAGSVLYHTTGHAENRLNFSALDGPV